MLFTLIHPLVFKCLTHSLRKMLVPPEDFPIMITQTNQIDQLSHLFHPLFF